MRDDRIPSEPGYEPAASEPGEPASSDGASFAEGPSLLDLANVVLRHRRTVALSPLALAVIVVIVTILLPRSYTAEASFMPHGDREQVSRLAGIASQLGIAIPSGGSGQSPDFYANLLRSRELLKSAVRTTYEIGGGESENGDARSGDLVDFYDIDEETRSIEVAEAVELLREDLSVSTNPETSVIDVRVTSRWPELSHQIANRLLELVNEFNLERRQSQASAERAFIEEQLARADSALRAAEDSLERFLESNRGYQGSPTLMFEHDRLEQRVGLRRQLFTSLSESFQQARISEVRNTPVVTVVERPEVPPRPDPRDLPFRAASGMLVGGVFALLWAFGTEMVRGARRQEPHDYVEFSRLIAETKRDLRRLYRRLPWARSD